MSKGDVPWDKKGGCCFSKDYHVLFTKNDEQQGIGKPGEVIVFSMVDIVYSMGTSTTVVLGTTLSTSVE